MMAVHANDPEIVYIKGDRNVEVNKRKLLLGDIVSLECSSQSVESGLKSVPVMQIPDTGEQRFVVSVLEIIKCIHQKNGGHGNYA